MLMMYPVYLTTDELKLYPRLTLGDDSITQKHYKFELVTLNLYNYLRNIADFTKLHIYYSGSNSIRIASQLPTSVIDCVPSIGIEINIKCQLTMYFFDGHYCAVVGICDDWNVIVDYVRHKFLVNDVLII